MSVVAISARMGSGSAARAEVRSNGPCSDNWYSASAAAALESRSHWSPASPIASRWTRVITVKSPPALNARPRPVSTTARTWSSPAIRSQTVASAVCRASLAAFRWSGRFSSMSRIGPSADRCQTVTNWPTFVGVVLATRNLTERPSSVNP